MELVASEFCAAARVTFPKLPNFLIRLYALVDKVMRCGLPSTNTLTFKRFGLNVRLVACAFLDQAPPVAPPALPLWWRRRFPARVFLPVSSHILAIA